MKISRVEIDRNLCVGSATCVVIAPDAFELDGDGISIFKKDGLTVDAETVLKAAKSCPTQAISVFDERGRRIWPE